MNIQRLGLNARATTAAAILLAVITQVPPVSAAPSAASAEEMRAAVARVFGADDPVSELSRLSDAEKAVLEQAMQHQEGRIVRVSPAERTSVQTAGTSATALAAASCWSQYVYMEWRDFGYHEGDTWMQLNWCATSGVVTSFSVPLAGCRGVAGFSCSGVIDSGSLNVGWEIRAYKQFHFYFGFLNAQPCQQIRGGSTGLYSNRASCNLS